MKKYIPFYFMFSGAEKIKRDITPGDKVGDLRKILRVSENTVITFIYKNIFLDPDDENTKEAYLHKIIDYFESGRGSPDYMADTGGRVKRDSVIFVEGAHKTTNFTTDKGITIEYKNIKYNERGKATVNGVEGGKYSEGWRKFMGEPYSEPWGDLRNQTESFSFDEYEKKNIEYMKEKYGDYTIMSHGSIENSFFFVPKNITVILNSELGQSIATRGGDVYRFADSVRTQTRLGDKSYSMSTDSESQKLIQRIYEPGSIIPEHDLSFRGWWDPMGSGLIPTEVYEIVDTLHPMDLEQKLNDYNIKYEKWNPLRAQQNVKNAKKTLLNYDIQIEYLTGWGVEQDEKPRKGELWFNLFPIPGERINLSYLLYWLSNKVGGENIKVYCQFCRNLKSQSKFEDELKQCLSYDKEIFSGTFLQGLSGESNILELSRQGSFSSLKNTKNNILSELERFKKLGIDNKIKESNPNYNIKKLITLNKTKVYSTNNIYSDHLFYLLLKVTIPDFEEKFTEESALGESIKDLLKIETDGDKFILDKLQDGDDINISLNHLKKHVPGCMENGDCKELETKIDEIIKKIADYYNKKLAGGDINNLNLYRYYIILSEVVKKDEISEDEISVDKISIQDFCHILLFMKLMREKHEHVSSEPEPVTMMAEPHASHAPTPGPETEPQPPSTSEKPEQGVTDVSAGGGRRRKKKRKTKRKKSKKNPKRKSKRRTRRRH